MKSRKTMFLRIVYFAALIFVIMRVHQENLFQLPERIKYDYLLYSLLCLLIGMFFSAFSWYMLLHVYKTDIPFLAAINSYCRTILSKYIPGKVWAIISPVTYLSKFTTLRYSSLMGFSILHQIMVIWTGIIFGMVVFTQVLSSYNLLVTSLCLLLIPGMLILFPKFTVGMPLRAYCMITKTDMSKYAILLNEKAGRLKTVIIWYCFMWLLYSAGFFFLVASVSETGFPILSAFAFPCASVLGILSVFTVGGIGVREGVIAYVLVNYGFTTELSVTISSLSRFWFLIGEVIAFSASFVISGKIQSRTYTTIILDQDVDRSRHDS